MSGKSLKLRVSAGEKRGREVKRNRKEEMEGMRGEI